MPLLTVPLIQLPPCSCAELIVLENVATVEPIASFPSVPPITSFHTNGLLLSVDLL